MRQPLHYPWLNLDVDDLAASVIAVRVDVIGTKAEVPDHRHRKGQLVFALAGGVTCRVPSGLWMVPPHCGVWVPALLRLHRAGGCRPAGPMLRAFDLAAAA
jgi:hypothetical protein